VTCSACGSENPAGRKFCGECGTPLAVGCPSCGAPTTAGQRFCGECGSALGTAPSATPARPAPSPARPTAAPTPASTPVAERRLVSVLFADLVGFTTLAEGRDAEEVRDLLSRYFDLAREVIARYGGVVEKFIGDAVMAVWGAPTAQEDDAERAVRAGLELIESIGGLLPGLNARAGVLTGEAAVTIGATNQGMVAGDIVNTASRLQSVAPPGTVLVGESTRRAAAGAIAFEEAGEQLLKGKAAPVPAFRAVRVVAERGGRGRSEVLEAPFVGRADELRLLKDLFHATGRESRARLVSVVGPAGIGKSRLSWEFLKYIDGVMDTVWWHDGRSPAYGEGISFWALGEMIRARCRLLESDDEATTRQKVAEAVALHVPREEDRRWIERSLLTLLGIDSGMPADQLFAAWRTFFESMSTTGAVALVFEDLHFADPGLLDFIDHLLEWSRNVPIFVLTLARPELIEKRPDWGAGKRQFTSVYLDPLPEPAMRELLAGLVPGLPESAVRRIVARADGVPLYAVETVRMLVTEGRLVLDGDRYVPVGDLEDLAVPETLTALIGARLDALEPGDRALVQHAAVLGQSFPAGALAAVSGLPVGDVEGRLRLLVRREIMTVESDPRSPERGQYAFVQALIREVAYHTLSRRDRKDRHLAAARYFESLGSDEIPGVLAGHYLAARENAGDGPEADALAAQARVSLRAAGDRAFGLGAYVQAEAFYLQAATVAADAADEADLLEQAGEAAHRVARTRDAERHLVRAIELRRAGADRAATALAIANLGRVIAMQYDTDRGIALLSPAIEEFADLGVHPATLALDQAIAAVYGNGERSVEAVRHAERALLAAEQLGRPEDAAEALSRKGSGLILLRRGYEGVSLIRGAIALGEAIGAWNHVARGKGALAIHLGHDDPTEALRLYREVIDQSKRYGLRARVVGSVGNATEVARPVGEWDLALRDIEELLASGLDTEAYVWLMSGAAVIRAWRGEDITPLLVEAQALLGSAPTPSSAVDLDVLAYTIAFVEGRYAEARQIAHRLATPLNAIAAYQDAIQCAIWDRDVEAVREELASLRALSPRGAAVQLHVDGATAAIEALSGETAAARSRYLAVTEGFRTLRLRAQAAFTAVDMAFVLDPAEPEVAAEIARGRATFMELRATPFVALLDRLVVEAPARAGGTERARSGTRAGSASEAGTTSA
jgi:class 3 adenylate cyclase/tetratricopeptide (TPR) repeat protein